MSKIAQVSEKIMSCFGKGLPVPGEAQTTVPNFSTPQTVE
jgi:hypothetical protein